MGKRKLTDEQIEEICRLYKSGISSVRLGMLFDSHSSTIRMHLKRNDVEIKSRKLKVSTGDKFGRWTVIEECEQNGYTRYFLCECNCINKTLKKIAMGALKNGTSSSCGCYNIEKLKGRKENVLGLIFGRLTIISDTIHNYTGFGRRVLAQCSCDGNIKEYKLSNIKNGHTNSCGCYGIEKTKESNTGKLKDYQEKYPLFCKVEEIRDCETGLGVEVRCRKCGEWFKPGRLQLKSRISVIEKTNRHTICTENNFYCSDNCKNSCPLYNLRSDPLERKEVSDNVPTSNELKIWSDEVLKQQLAQYGYNFCTKCQRMENLAAHHIDPKKIEPFYALDPDNGIVFCSDCHYGEGHNGECSMVKLANKVCKP